MDLRRLEHLLALAEERHFGRAADQVHLSCGRRLEFVFFQPV